MTNVTERDLEGENHISSDMTIHFILVYVLPLRIEILWWLAG